MLHQGKISEELRIIQETTGDVLTDRVELHVWQLSLSASRKKEKNTDRLIDTDETCASL